jgi:hypothetical protein
LGYDVVILGWVIAVGRVLELVAVIVLILGIGGLTLAGIDRRWMIRRRRKKP